MPLKNPHSKGLVHILWHHHYVVGNFGGSRVCLKEAGSWRYAIKDNDENLAFLLCISNCYKYCLLLLLCIYGICVWCLDIHTNYHTCMEVRRQFNGISSLSPHFHGSGIELKLSGFAWMLLDTKSSHWTSSFTCLFPNCQQRHRILCHMFFAMMWRTMTS